MPENILPLSFFASYDTLTLAQKLLGCELVHDSPDGISSGIIVETEAYLQDDPACHAYNRRTSRTEPMFEIAGTIYVYQIYGIYQCVNVVSNKKGIGEAVLIRALQPSAGIDLMKARRNEKRHNRNKPTKEIELTQLCNGPGKLVIAMGIDRAIHNNELFSASRLYINPANKEKFEIVSTTRIGISVGIDLPYRFMIRNNPFVSKR